MSSAAVLTEAPLPVGGVGHRGVGFWGVLGLIATEAALFVYLLFSYFYYAVQLPDTWRPLAHLPLKLSAPNTVILLASSVAVWWGERGVRRGARVQPLIGVGLGVALGALFLAIQLEEWRELPFTIRSGVYGSLFYTITGFHMAHVAAGVVALAFVWLWSALGYFDPRRDSPVTITSFYWHFVDAVWLCVWFTFYLSPYLG